MSKETPTTVDVYAVLCDIREFTKLQNQVMADIREHLKSCDVSLQHLVGLSEERIKRLQPANANGTSAVASDADLDSQHGDPEIKAKSPRDWNGPDMKGKRFSECPPEYLDQVADRLSYFTSQLGNSDEDKKKRHYNTLDERRARGWAARLRVGYKPKAAEPPSPPADNPFGSDDNIAF